MERQQINTGAISERVSDFFTKSFDALKLVRKDSPKQEQVKERIKKPEYKPITPGQALEEIKSTHTDMLKSRIKLIRVVLQKDYIQTPSSDEHAKVDSLESHQKNTRHLIKYINAAILEVQGRNDT
jgi:hypothetical protein